MLLPPDCIGIVKTYFIVQMLITDFFFNYNMIIHYFDNRIRKQANTCLYQSVSKMLHTLKMLKQMNFHCAVFRFQFLWVFFKIFLFWMFRLCLKKILKNV
jgi:hypothetical protein